MNTSTTPTRCRGQSDGGADLVAERRVYECDVSQSQQDLVWTPDQSNLIDASPRQQETAGWSDRSL